jgi:hypothetical protein
MGELSIDISFPCLKSLDPLAVRVFADLRQYGTTECRQFERFFTDHSW